jgi:hypothetical protein
VQERPCDLDRNVIRSLALLQATDAAAELRSPHFAGEQATWEEAEGEKSAQQEEAAGWGSNLHGAPFPICPTLGIDPKRALNRECGG